MNNDYGNELLHKVLLSAMKDIDKICRENGLKYYLHAGTLLGAINHKGFIPWDDDVDLTIFREDYEKLAEIINRDYKEKYFLQTYESDEYYRNNRAVLRISGTKLKFMHETENIEHQEIGVDIAPLYAVPDSKFFQKIQQGLIWILDAAVQIKYKDIIPQKIWTKCISVISLFPRKVIGRWMDFVMKHMGKRNSKYVGILCYTGKNPYTGRSGYYNDVMPREWYQEVAELPFEDTKFMAISSPEKDLISRYGEHYAEPYPEEKRITKHDVAEYEISEEVLERL